MSRLLILMAMLGIGALVFANLGGCPWLDVNGQSGDAGDTDDGGDGADGGDGSDGTDAGDTDDGTDGGDEVAEKTLHEKIFVDILGQTEFDGIASSCLICHSNHARDILETAHWNWQGPVTNIEGLEGELHGKRDLLNNL
jgi:hypothetical protein